jgi:hypothetical protein
MRATFLFVMLLIPAFGQAAPWVALSGNVKWESYRLDAGSIVELAESRMALVEHYQVVDGSKRKISRLVEADCKQKASRTLLVESSDDLAPFHFINRDKPDWVEGDFSAGNVVFEICKTKPTRRQKKLQFIFGAIGIESFVRNVKITSIVDFRMPLFGDQLQVEVLATDCEKGFGSLKADSYYTVSLNGKTRPDIAFWYLCKLGMSEAYAFDKQRKQDRAAAGVNPADEEKALAKAMLFRELLDRGRSEPDSAPKTRQETVCKYDPLSQSTKCQTVEKPCIGSC